MVGVVAAITGQEPLVTGKPDPAMHAEFEPTGTQRKLLRRHADLDVSACKPWTTDEQMLLLRRYLAESPSRRRHGGDGRERLCRHGRADSVRTYVIEYREPSVDGRPGKLVGACLSDQQSDGLSMIYSFFDVGPKARKGPRHLHHPRSYHSRARAGLPYVYLGYWVDGSPRMAYKTASGPSSGSAAMAGGGWTMSSSSTVNQPSTSQPGATAAG